LVKNATKKMGFCGPGTPFGQFEPTTERITVQIPLGDYLLSACYVNQSKYTKKQPFQPETQGFRQVMEIILS